MSVSGHKSESSLKHYSRVAEGHKRQMSLCLSEKCHQVPDSGAKVKLASPRPRPRSSPSSRFGPGPGSSTGPPGSSTGPPCTITRPPLSPVVSLRSTPDVSAQPQPQVDPDLDLTVGLGPETSGELEVQNPQQVTGPNSQSSPQSQTI